MNFDWILSPLTPYATIALALAASLACFLSTKTEVCRLRRVANRSQQELQHKMEEMETAMAGLSRQPEEPALPAPPQAVTLRPSLNLTRRTRALRMRRRGETVESIAAALAAPRNEIELLLKVYEIVEYRKQLRAPETIQ